MTMRKEAVMGIEEVLEAAEQLAIGLFKKVYLVFNRTGNLIYPYIIDGDSEEDDVRTSDLLIGEISEDMSSDDITSMVSKVLEQQRLLEQEADGWNFASMKSNYIDGLVISLKMEKPEELVSPGGYECLLRDGRVIGFDFMDTESAYNAEKGVLNVYCRNIDTVSFPESDGFSEFDVKNIEHFTEIFVYAGEEDIPEMSIQSLQFLFKDGGHYEVPEELLCRIANA